MFLRAGAALGGGLLLSVHLPFASREAKAAPADRSSRTPSFASAAMGKSF
jgi:hypothetical protein